MKKISSPLLCLLLSPLVLALSFAMDTYAPTIPPISAYFHSSDHMMLLTMNLFMLAAGATQLIIGPLADSYGRKPITLLTIHTFSLGCLVCALASNVTLLILGRVIQATGSCGMMVMGFTIVRDYYAGNRGAKIYSILYAIIALAPMFAPFIGTAVYLHFGFRVNFSSLLLISVLSLISLRNITETQPTKQRLNFSLTTLLKTYKSIFFNPNFALYNLATCFGQAYLYLFCTISSYLIIRELQIPASDYPYYFFYMGLSAFLGSLLCASIAEKIGVYRACLVGFVISLIGGVWMLYNQLSFGLQLSGLCYPMLLIGIGGSVCMGAGNGGAMEPFGRKAGTASALGGALRFLSSAVIGAACIPAQVHDTHSLSIPAILFSLLGLILFLSPAPKKQLTQVSR